MTKLEQKLVELGYELSGIINSKVDKVIIKIYSKRVEQKINEIFIDKYGIYKTLAENEIEMQKDLGILKECEK